jgi:hypothetical protein
MVKVVNPTTYTDIRGRDGQKTTNEESACVGSRRVGRIRKGLFPQLDVGLTVGEFDKSKKVFPGPWKPRSGDKAAGFEYRWFIV